MLAGNKGMLLRECARRNEERRVRKASVDHRAYFRKMRGDLLISGYGAAHMELLGDLICEYMRREDMPTVVLSGHRELFHTLRAKRRDGEIDRLMLSDPGSRNYHPFYGMDPQQFLHLLHLTASGQGYSQLLDQALQYASAALQIVAASYPVSLPALDRLLLHDDDFISGHALRMGFSNVTADHIRGNHQAGILLRRVLKRLEGVFEEVYTPGSDTRYNFQSGALGNVAVMAFYAVSQDQRLLNAYLKEELAGALKRVPRLRVVADELPFDSGEDELLKYLFQMKRLGKIELAFISRNAREAVFGGSLSFPNVLLFPHDDPGTTQELSRELWGLYKHHYPVPAAGKPPALLFTLRTTVHWQIETEERERVRAEDLYARPGIFSRGSDFLAIKSMGDDRIYLTETSAFLPGASGPPAVRNF